MTLCHYIQISFRRKKVLSVLKNYKPQKVLEIGCGYRPLFMDFKSFEKFTIIIMDIVDRITVIAAGK